MLGTACVLRSRARSLLQVRWHSVQSTSPRQATLRQSCPLASPSSARHGATMLCGRSLQPSMQTLALAAVLRGMG